MDLAEMLTAPPDVAAWQLSDAELLRLIPELSLRWSNGGPTNLSNLVLLCRFHHTTIHRGDWTVHISKDDGHPWFTPPTWIDPRRQPVPAHNRRNQLLFAA
ncbi:HNH endonuclease signature motif containing protein [Rhodococcus oryzae]|uniref:HNH endonuclease signature motif containing protein n=1 Tax=Rhodococcus oryzae TaxID=2571143 RepID=UPI0037B0196D